jgi:cytochrome c oxidase assembly protein subunit 15
MMPPIGTAAWQEAFAKYQLTPEYIQKNSGMDMDSFQTIYFWEWLHRLWGRLIGLVYVLPLIWFWIRKQVPGELKPRLVFFLFLGGLQGAIGWYMVKSGLIDEPRVSHYRLALHLAAAFVLFALLWAQALQLLPKFRHALLSYQPYVKFCIKRHAWVALFLVSATILWGAFVAGLDAGLIYNTFPMMNGKWVPDEFLFEKPWWKNFLRQPCDRAMDAPHVGYGQLRRRVLSGPARHRDKKSDAEKDRPLPVGHDRTAGGVGHRDAIDPSGVAPGRHTPGGRAC